MLKCRLDFLNTMLDKYGTKVREGEANHEWGSPVREAAKTLRFALLDAGRAVDTLLEHLEKEGKDSL